MTSGPGYHETGPSIINTRPHFGEGAREPKRAPSRAGRGRDGRTPATLTPRAAPCRLTPGGHANRRHAASARRLQTFHQQPGRPPFRAGSPGETTSRSRDDLPGKPRKLQESRPAELQRGVLTVPAPTE